MENLTKNMTEMELENVYLDASQAGLEAGDAIQPRTMVVTDQRTGDSWTVEEGPCGFAWVVIKPGNSRFARFLKKYGRADNHYYGGVSVWISEYGQSVDRKSAFAAAFASKLREFGINAYAESRLD